MSVTQDLNSAWQSAFDEMPLIAILRGIQPDECVEIAGAIFDAGFRILEVPLNSPNPFDSIASLTKMFPEHFIGAGTVTTVEAVESCAAAGCRLIVTPNFNSKIASAVKAHNIMYFPGVATPSEAFAALEAGADGLKLFPGEMITPTVVKAMRAVLPATTSVIPVGGVTATNMADYVAAGANGFGIGSALYRPAKSIEEIRASAKIFVDTHKALSTPASS
jgi:2-dehydro-3-deoxyphosphogalactonate aldolase